MFNKKRKKEKNKGAAMLIAVIFLLFISLAIISGLIVPSVREYQTASENINSKRSYFLAESGVEDATYRILTGRPISGSETLTLDSNITTTTINSSGNQKDIISLGDVKNFERKVDLVLRTGAGIAFNYGLQSGNGGVTMGGGSTIRGNIYSNGDINAVSATITGSAVAADGASLTADQVNNTPSTPTNSINFRNATGTQDFAQSFQLSATSLINKAQFYIKKVGSPADATVKLVANNNGSPNTTVIDSVSLSAGSVTTNFGWVEVVFPNTPSLVSDTTYWLFIDNSSQNASNYYIMGANADSSYSVGTAKTGSSSGVWSTTNLDGYFKVYTGGVPSIIGGASYVGGLQVGTGGTGDAWATNVKGVSVSGHLYCTTGTYNNKSCDTSHGVPAPQPLPFSEANIDAWKDEGTNGGIITGSTNCPGGSSNGDCIINWKGATFGPGKITGNLTVNGGGTLTLTGTVYVVGTVTVTGGGKIRLPENFALNSGTIISDGIMSIQGGGSLGSGTQGSYLFLVSTSKCPYDAGCGGSSAIHVSGGAGAIAVNAQYGNVLLDGGATLNAAVGNSITVGGGAEVTYDQGLASPSFSSGPSGSWVIDTWKETQ